MENGGTEEDKLELGLEEGHGLLRVTRLTQQVTQLGEYLWKTKTNFKNFNFFYL